MVRNYNDPNITGPTPMPKLYLRTLGANEKLLWDYSWVPDAVVINLGTNDYGTLPNPPKEVFEHGISRYSLILRL